MENELKKAEDEIDSIMTLRLAELEKEISKKNDQINELGLRVFKISKLRPIDLKI